MEITNVMAVEVSGIEFAPDFIREVGDQASEERVVVSSIRGCRFAYGSVAKYPGLKAIMGSVCRNSSMFVWLSSFTLQENPLRCILKSRRRFSQRLESSGLEAVSCMDTKAIKDRPKRALVNLQPDLSRFMLRRKSHQLWFIFDVTNT